MKARLDRTLLRVGYALSAVLGAVVYLAGFGLVAAIGALLGLILITRLSIYFYFERFLAFKTFEDFTSGKVRHECIACGASCHLKVNLGSDDVERVLKYAKSAGMKETVVEKSGNHYWLRRKGDGACIFLTHQNGLPRCSIYSIRPIACRLYPLIPTGNRLKVDPLCPGVSHEHGHTFKEHLITQEVGSYVRKVMGKI